MPQLPEKLRPYFWDTDFDSLDKEINKGYIISRLYTKGRVEGMLWVNRNYTEKDIIYAAKKRRDLTPIVANYLQKKYGLKREEMAYYRLAQNGNHWR